jgi:hypothetical protein
MPKLALEIRDLSLPATILLPRLDDSHILYSLSYRYYEYDGIMTGYELNNWDYDILWLCFVLQHLATILV